MPLTLIKYQNKLKTLWLERAGNNSQSQDRGHAEFSPVNTQS